MFSQLEVDNLLEDLNDESSVAAYISASADTTTTTATTWYPILGTFVNDLNNFVVEGNAIKYIGTNKYKFEIDWHAKFATNTVGTTANITVSKSGTAVEGSKMGVFMKTTGEPYSLSGTEIVTLETNDTIQLVVQSDKSGAVLTFGQFVTTLNKFTIKRQA